MAEWICNGVPKDGKKYPRSAGEAHEPHSNTEKQCDICLLPQEAMNPQKQLPVKVIVGVGAFLVVGMAIAVIVSSISDRCPPGMEKIEAECVDPYLTVHKDAITDGDAAQAIIRRYRSVEELEQAKNYLASAITDLSSIPESALVYDQAQSKLEEYDKLAIQINNVINNFQLCAVEPKPDDCLF